MNLHDLSLSWCQAQASVGLLAAGGFDFNRLAHTLGDACFGFLGINFAWGLYCVILSWRRTKQLRFRSHQDHKAQQTPAHVLLEQSFEIPRALLDFHPIGQHLRCRQCGQLHHWSDFQNL